MTDKSCRRHQWEVREDECSSCRHGYCAQCLIYVHGPRKPPMCVQCALARSGVRAGGRSPRLGWRERRQQEKLRKRTAAAVRESRRAAEQHAAGEDVEPLFGIEGLEDQPSVGSWASIDLNGQPG